MLATPMYFLEKTTRIICMPPYEISADWSCSALVALELTVSRSKYYKSICQEAVYQLIDTQAANSEERTYLHPHRHNDPHSKLCSGWYCAGINFGSECGRCDLRRQVVLGAVCVRGTPWKLPLVERLR